MIVEAADYRAVGRHAIRLGQVAAADTDRDGIADTLTHHRALHAVLDDLARRWGEPHSAPAPGPPRTVPPEPPCPRDLIEEQALVATLIADPRALDEIARWLGPGDFADRAHVALYRCIAALVHRGDVVDPLTVLWEAQRRGHLADGSLGPELVVSIGAPGVPGSTEYRAKRVLRAAVLRTATAGSRTVRDLADDRTLPIPRLVSSAREVLAPLDAIHNRWNTATRPPSVGTPAGESAAPTSPTRTAARSRTTTTTSPPPPAPVPGGPTAATTSTARRRP
ncbi:DnaB-like helicase N-terminal domain-containing protein [Embleya sp. MST-111070]|uniref:DnaB-like helicase N-terminal domain-containing protein n=1 Tax=Embleya sp. MST-111070 TaxID=3398231 RepID=UPI003F73BC16